MMDDREIMNGNYKHYIFDISKYVGYRQIVEKSNLKSFGKLECDGFSIMYNTTYSIKFKIGNQLLRSLKLKNISGSVKFGSTEYQILELVERSKQFEPNDTADFGAYGYFNSYTLYGSYEYY